MILIKAKKIQLIVLKEKTSEILDFLQDLELFYNENSDKESVIKNSTNTIKTTSLYWWIRKDKIPYAEEEISKKTNWEFEIAQLEIKENEKSPIWINLFWMVFKIAWSSFKCLKKSDNIK